MKNYPPKSRKESEVWQVCDALILENKKITYQAVGDRLQLMGLCRGSNSDLCRYITTWKNKGTSDTQIDPTKNIPSLALQESWQKNLLDMLEYQQNQFDKLFNALQKSKKINAILQQKLYSLTQRHTKLRKRLHLISRSR